jgi:hypothetical protein
MAAVAARIVALLGGHPARIQRPWSAMLPKRYMDWNAQFEPRDKTASTLSNKTKRQEKHDRTANQNQNSLGNPELCIFIVDWERASFCAVALSYRQFALSSGQAWGSIRCGKTRG